MKITVRGEGKVIEHKNVFICREDNGYLVLHEPSKFEVITNYSLEKYTYEEVKE